MIRRTNNNRHFIFISHYLIFFVDTETFKCRQEIIDCWRNSKFDVSWCRKSIELYVVYQWFLVDTVNVSGDHVLIVGNSWLLSIYWTISSGVCDSVQFLVGEERERPPCKFYNHGNIVNKYNAHLLTTSWYTILSSSPVCLKWSI